jgi:AraC family transcriptional regulator
MADETRREYLRRILRVLVYLQEHLDESLPLEDLARIAHFSPFHFHRIFRGIVGEPVMEHVRGLRLERAAGRLKAGDEAILRIALDAGYDSHEAFTRAFGSQYGCSPSELRRRQRELLEEVREARAASAGKSLDVRVERFAPLRVLSVRHTGSYDQVGSAWRMLMMWAGMSGLIGAGAEMIGVPHDDPDSTPPDKLRYDACVTLASDATAPLDSTGIIGQMELTGGDYAITTHRGPYDRLGETYLRLMGNWLPGSGHEARDAPALEVYRNSPLDTAPQDLLTDIRLPLV